jgi:hypothetical protein
MKKDTTTDKKNRLPVAICSNQPSNYFFNKNIKNKGNFAAQTHTIGWTSH